VEFDLAWSKHLHWGCHSYFRPDRRLSWRQGGDSRPYSPLISCKGAKYPISPNGLVLYQLTYPKKSATMQTYFPRSKDTQYVSTWMHNNHNNHCIKSSYEVRTITDSPNMPDSLRLLRQMLGFKCEIHLNHTNIDINLGNHSHRSWRLHCKRQNPS
jgi:hypothetical protein